MFNMNFKKDRFVFVLLLYVFCVLFLIIKNSFGNPFLIADHNAEHERYEISGLGPNKIVVDAVDHALYYDLENIPVGEHSVTVRASDVWGNWSAPSPPFLFKRPSSIGGMENIRIVIE